MAARGRRRGPGVQPPRPPGQSRPTAIRLQRVADRRRPTAGGWRRRGRGSGWACRWSRRATGIIQTGFHGPAGLAGLEFFDGHPPSDDRREGGAAAPSRCSTPARRRPARCRWCSGRAGGGVLFHEACGHGLEADHRGKEASVYRGRVGEMLASPLVTGVDDATVPNAWGSFSFDDEGTPAQRTVLFAGGRAHRLHVRPAPGRARTACPRPGTGGASPTRILPIPRMTNSYILAGESKAGRRAGRHHARAVRDGAGRRAGATPPPATSCSACQRGVPDRGRARHRARCAARTSSATAIEVLSAIDAVADDFDTWRRACAARRVRAFPSATAARRSASPG